MSNGRVGTSMKLVNTRKKLEKKKVKGNAKSKATIKKYNEFVDRTINQAVTKAKFRSSLKKTGTITYYPDRRKDAKPGSNQENKDTNL